jgi:4-diphosphocytidyl-2-C-methyl-D-erythritol kinase
MITLHAPAKINLYLKILGRRPDGYHELETLMQKVALYDALELSLTDEPGISLSCPDADLPEDERNIAFRAARLFLSRTGRARQGVQIVLRKRIPTAAGLGGGSSDAAAVLKGLNQLLRTGFPAEELAAMGLQLGADVPLFIHDFPAAWATGIGERLEAAEPLRGCKALLVNPGIAVSTKWVYQQFSERIALTEAAAPFTLSSPLSRAWRHLPSELFNDFEAVTAARHSEISSLKKRLLAAGASKALMSGSGSTVFGLFADHAAEQAEQCCHELQKEYGQTFLVAPLT